MDNLRTDIQIVECSLNHDTWLSVFRADLSLDDIARHISYTDMDYYTCNVERI